MKDLYIILKTGLALLGVLVGVWSCQKVDGYYDFQNKESVFAGNSLAYLGSKKGVFDSTLKVLDRLPDYKIALENDSVTFFVPTNESFAVAISNLNLVRKNSSKAPLYLANLDLASLDTLFSKYLAKGIHTTDSMTYVDGLSLETLKYDHEMHAQRVKNESSGFLDGGILRVYFSDTKGSNFVSQWTRTSTQAVNVVTENGVIHILSGNHEFGFGEFITRMNK